MQTPPIDELVARSADGDKRAQHVLFRAYRHNITRLVWRMLGPRPRAELEDAIQQVYIQVFRSLRHFRGEASFDTWVYRIAAKVCMQEIRKKYRKRRRMLIRTDREALEAVADETFSPEVSAERRETVRRLYAALARLNPHRRTAMRWRPWPMPPRLPPRGGTGISYSESNRYSPNIWRSSTGLLSNCLAATGLG